VKGTIHWVSASHGIDAEVRLYDRLFTVEKPDAKENNFEEFLNPESLTRVTAKVEPSLASASPGDRFQFERTGYFCTDDDSTAESLVFNRTVPLRDSWAKLVKKGQA
jgi:glutaminyl-tRNA synthetase